MFKRFVDEKGFTLMELLIAVAIVVILAGVGIPVYLKFQAGAKASEANTNLNGIKLAEEAYKLGNGSYLDCAASPRAAAALATAGQTAVAWADTATGFTNIGFTTTANVRFVYQVSSASTTAFVAESLGDTNADGNRILFVATQNSGPHVIGDPTYTAVDGAITLALGTVTDTAD
ncbi:prepilin-type N-terminal cleavage/methylation domain-containing protein [Candidatus Poribacteria bacterium]|nr:prepilin-type N-terminal cleavage/methylation domain-containing protein [Candidatus Poribacteria bacterium]